MLVIWQIKKPRPTLKKHDGHLRTRGKCRKHEPQASSFYISRVLYDIDFWPIRARAGSYLHYNTIYDSCVIAKHHTCNTIHDAYNQFTTRLAVTGRVSRSCQLLNIPLYTSSTGQRTFYYRMARIWNNLDSTFKTAKSISTFKFYLKNKSITDFLNSTSWQYVSILLAFILFCYNLT